MSEHTEETKFAFVGEVIGTVEELFEMTKRRQDRDNKVVGIMTNNGTQDSYVDDNDLMPTEMWINQNRIKQRREAFIKYFIKDDDEVEEESALESGSDRRP